MSEPASPQDNRWWESYVVRYLVPTMTGMLFLRWLQQHSAERITPLLPTAGALQPPIFAKLGMAELLVWAGSGFAFAYLASLPILVFHATRSLETRGSAEKKLVFSPTQASVLLIVTTALSTLVKPAMLPQWGPAGIVAVFSAMQLHRIWRSITPNFHAASYAQDLAAARSAGRTRNARQKTKEYVTSYRHLREHGNAAFIVLLQVTLCALLYMSLKAPKDVDTAAAGDTWQWVTSLTPIALLVLWVAPAAAIHALSQRLEGDMVPKSVREHQTKLAVDSVQVVTASPVQVPTQAPTSPTSDASNAKLRLRALKAVSQFSSLLLPVAFCPPVLLLWIHLNDLHYPALLMPALSSTAGLGTLLLLGAIVWLLWVSSLALPSVSVALIASLYGPGKVPKLLALAWIGVMIGAAGYCLTTTQFPKLTDTIGFFQAYALLSAILGLVVYRLPPGALRPGNKWAPHLSNSLSGLLAFLVSFFALCLVLLPLSLVGRAYGKEPDSLALVVGIVAFSFFGALMPGIAYLWSNIAKKSEQPARRPMPVTGFAAILLIPPLASVVLLTALKAQFSHLILVTSGIADKGGESARPQLYRLPDNWTNDDRLLAASFPSLARCADSAPPQIKGNGWLCGYRNFSFGTTQLICDRSYSDDVGQPTKHSLTCVAFIGNQIVNLAHLPPPRPPR